MKVTYENGKIVKKELLSSEVVTEKTDTIIAHGTIQPGAYFTGKLTTYGGDCAGGNGTSSSGISLSPTTVLYKFGQIASSNVNGKSNYTSNLTGYKSTINIAYESDYSQWKNFIKYVNTYADKSTIDALSASYNEATGVVTGTASISLYSIEGGKRDYKEPSFDVKTGTGNIFSTVTPTE